MEEETFTLADIVEIDPPDDKIYCISVDSPGHEFLIGRIGAPTHNSDDAKAQMALKGEAQSIIGSIARLGRAAGVFLTIATQRPDAKLLPGELKANLGMRLGCGHMQATASSMTLESASGTQTPGSPKGRAVISVYGSEQRAQIYFAPQEWIDEWLDKRGLNQDGTPKTTGPSAFIDRGVDGLSGSNLDDLQGVDNSDYIARTRAEKEKIAMEHARKMREQGVESDIPGLSIMPPETAVNEGDALGYQKGMTRDEDDDYHIGRPELKGETHGRGGRPEDEWDDSMDAIFASDDGSDGLMMDDGTGSIAVDISAGTGATTNEAMGVDKSADIESGDSEANDGYDDDVDGFIVEDD